MRSSYTLEMKSEKPCDYLEEESLIPIEGHTNALFLSMQMKRLEYARLKIL